MGSKICMNPACSAAMTWMEGKRGWGLKGGGYATLCNNCGSAYDNSLFCNTFHLNETGWRECLLCLKRIHCGCIASKILHEYMDFGGICCTNCVKLPEAEKDVKDPTPEQTKQEQPVVRNMYGSPSQPMLKFSLSTQSFYNGSEGPEQNRGSPYILPDPIKHSPNTSSEAVKVPPPPPPQVRVARPPADGRGRHQLLPRYWPKITDQELQQISGHLNSTIIPLFEKILSASDAGRIGRLVLPKACAEAYFPLINNSEGVPIRVQDITGMEWTFQFRFWPNNNSRMYVLEGVTPCMQNMQLEAGDTVTFSRIEPGGKLLIGARKATNNDTQEIQMNSLSIGASSGEEGTNDNVLVVSEKKTQNIGSKNKRLLIHSDDAMELKVTWEEAQELLRPYPTASPNIILIDDLEIEEYDDPPVFGKKTIFTTRPSGLEALATAAVLGDNTNELGESSSAATTKHPRHRPGCSCIVCIQPPSGKGKHLSSCTCNVCLTVRRRFKTLMQRKRKRLSAPEGEQGQEKEAESTKDVSETDVTVGEALLQLIDQENDNTLEAEMLGSNINFDLNSHPTREDGMNLFNFGNATSLPLEKHLTQLHLGTLGHCSPSQVASTSGHVSETTPTDMEREKKGE